jgi:hypothetical protein
MQVPKTCTENGTMRVITALSVEWLFSSGRRSVPFVALSCNRVCQFSFRRNYSGHKRFSLRFVAQKNQNEMLVMSNNQALSATEDADEDSQCDLANVESTFADEPNNTATSFRKVTSSIPSTSVHSDNSRQRSNEFKATVLPGVDDPIYVTVPGPNDILLGRGAPIINYEGNIRFRALVSTRKLEYVGSGRHQVKDGIAKSIIDEIQRRKGRFLRRVDPAKANVASADASGSDCEPTGSDEEKANTAGQKTNFISNKLYQVAEYDVAIEKVKQALRDKDTMKHQVDTSDESGASSGHVATLLQGQHHHQFLNVTNPETLPTMDYGKNSNVVGRTQGFGDEDPRNVSNDLIRNQQLQILSMQVQNRLASENLLLLNQQRLQQERNQLYLAGLGLSTPAIQALTIPQQLALLQAGSLSGFDSSQGRDNEAVLNNLRNRQQAELLSLMNSSVDINAVATALLSRNNVMNPYLRTDDSLLPVRYTEASVLEPEYQHLNRLLPGITTQSSYWTTAAALGLGHVAGSQRTGALSPSYQPSALLPVLPMGPSHPGSNLSDDVSSDFIRSVGALGSVSSTMQIMLGDSPQIFDDLKNKRKSSFEETGDSDSKSSTSNTLHSKESSIASSPTSRKKSRAN